MCLKLNTCLSVVLNWDLEVDSSSQCVMNLNCNTFPSATLTKSLYAIRYSVHIYTHYSLHCVLVNFFNSSVTRTMETKQTVRTVDLDHWSMCQTIYPSQDKGYIHFTLEFILKWKDECPFICITQTWSKTNIIFSCFPILSFLLLIIHHDCLLQHPLRQSYWVTIFSLP